MPSLYEEKRRVIVEKHIGMGSYLRVMTPLILQNANLAPAT